MKKLDFNKWIHLDKKFIISLICQCLLGPFFFKNKSGNSRLLVSGMKATGSQFLYVMSDIFLISPYPLTAVYVYDTVIP